MAQTSALALVLLLIAAVSAGPIMPAIGGFGLGMYGGIGGFGMPFYGMGLGYGYGMGVLPYAYGGLGYLGYGGFGYGMPLMGGMIGKKYYD